jgi:hypothetical protein
VLIACGDDAGRDDGSGGAGAAGGGDPVGGAPPAGCVDYAGLVLSPAPSFAADVMPIFQQSCTLSNACHSDQTPNPAGDGLSLGPPITMTPDRAAIDAVRATLLDGAAVRSSSPFVMPGRPGYSWLQQKLEYADFESCSLVQCGPEPPCGDQQPFLAPPLAKADRDRIAAWIAAGAQP